MDLDLEKEDLEDLKDILAWWRVRERNLSVIPSVIQNPSKRSVRSFRLDDGVYKSLRALAEDQNRSMSELANEAIKWYVAGAIRVET